MKKIALVLGLIAFVFAAPASAGQGDKVIRFGGAYSSPTGEYKEVYDEPPYYEEGEISADAALGPFVGFEFMFTDLFGLDATVQLTDHDVDSDYVEYFDGDLVINESTTIADVTAMPLFISGHFHFLQDGPVDLYAGPTLAYVMYSDLEFRPEFEVEDVKLKDDFGYGAVFGIDVPFGTDSNWMFSSKVRYIKTGAEIDEPDGFTIDIDPFIVEIGVGVKF